MVFPSDVAMVSDGLPSAKPTAVTVPVRVVVPLWMSTVLPSRFAACPVAWERTSTSRLSLIVVVCWICENCASCETNSKQLDDFIPGELLDHFEGLIGRSIAPDALGGDLIAVAAYAKVLGDYGPDSPTSNWLAPTEWLGDRLTYDAKAGLHQWWQGRLDQQAADLFLSTGDPSGLQRQALRTYHEAVNDAYAEGSSLLDKGRLPIYSEQMGERVALGIFVDRRANDAMGDWLGNLGLKEGAGTGIELNRWLRDPIDERNHRVPDVRIGNKIFDATIWDKRATTPQIQAFRNFGQPNEIIVVKPYALGGLHRIKY